MPAFGKLAGRLAHFPKARDRAAIVTRDIVRIPTSFEKCLRVKGRQPEGIGAGIVTL